jgi:hypothetical protein
VQTPRRRWKPGGGFPEDVTDGEGRHFAGPSNSERFADDERETAGSSADAGSVRPRGGELNEPAAAGARAHSAMRKLKILGRKLRVVVQNDVWRFVLLEQLPNMANRQARSREDDLTAMISGFDTSVFFPASLRASFDSSSLATNGDHQ